MASLRAGKHTFTEWLCWVAPPQRPSRWPRSPGSRATKTAVGVQAKGQSGHHSPAQPRGRRVRGQGDDLSRAADARGRAERGCRDGRGSADVELGANTLTIACGHTIDALCSVVGEFADVATVVSTQATTWHESDTGKDLPVTSPDNILVSGNLQSGAVASVQIGNTAWAGSGYQMEVYGEEGTLVAVSMDSPQLQSVRIRGARGGSNDLEDLTPPCGAASRAGDTRRVGLQRGPALQPVRSVNPRNVHRRSAQCPRLRSRRWTASPNRRHPAVQRRGTACDSGVYLVVRTFLIHGIRA